MGAMADLDWVQLVDLRVVGDDWHVHAVCAAVVAGEAECDWAAPVVQVRYGPSKAFALLASNDPDDDVADIDLSDTDFAAGVFHATIAAEDTVDVQVRSCADAHVYMELSVASEDLGGRKTVGRFKIPVGDEVAVEPVAP